jgi:hypothetical protein
VEGLSHLRWTKCSHVFNVSLLMQCGNILMTPKTSLHRLSL